MTSSSRARPFANVFLVIKVDTNARASRASRALWNPSTSARDTNVVPFTTIACPCLFLAFVSSRIDTRSDDGEASGEDEDENEDSARASLASAATSTVFPRTSQRATGHPPATATTASPSGSNWIHAGARV